MKEIITDSLYSNFFYYIYENKMYGFDFRKQLIYEIKKEKNFYIFNEKNEDDIPKKVKNYFKKIK